MRCRRARDELRVGSRARAVNASPIRYAENGDIHIAYQVVGDGPLDLVCVMGAMTNLNVLWDDPDYRRFCQRLASFSRLILFDKRGMGLSDRVRIGTLEERMDDVRAILDALGSDSAALLGVSEGGPMSMLFAATYPERTRAIVLCGAEVKEETTDDWPWGETTREDFDRSMDIDLVVATLGQGGLDRPLRAEPCRRPPPPSACCSSYRSNPQARTTRWPSCAWPSRSTSATLLRR